VSLGLLSLVASCSGRTTNVGDGPPGMAGSAGQSYTAGGGTLGGPAGQGAVAGNAGQIDSGGSGVGTAGSAGAVGVAGASAGTLRDYLGDPAFPDSFWRPASGAESQLDAAPLEQALRVIETSGWEIHSFLIALNGRLVFERYGWSSGTNPALASELPHQVLPSERQAQFSTTKSFLSALVGVALSEGAFADLKVHAADYFPDYALLNPSAEKSSITLEDLLTMRSGLQFMEGDQATFSTADPARAMFSRDVVDKPVGTVWNYSSGGANVVAEMLRVATGKTPLDYANLKLFGPIGVDAPPWDAGATGTNFGGFGLSLTAREMARFGELFRNSGRWQGQAVIPSTWTDESTAPRCSSPWGGQYGYLWWIPDLPGFFNALGSFGQMIYVNRERGLVIVFTAYMQNDVAKNNLERLIRDYVLPATH
jgi:Beta-lactamase